MIDHRLPTAYIIWLIATGCVVLFTGTATVLSLMSYIPANPFIAISILLLGSLPN